MSHAARVAVDAANALGEGVLWCSRRQVLYWTDIASELLWEFSPVDGATRTYPMPERLASFALCEADDWLLLALASRLAFYHLPSGELRPLHDIEPDLDTRANDGACDRQGRFVFGTLHEPAAGDKQPVGSFYRLNADLSLERLPLPHVAIANSIAFSPGGERMYFCDSIERRIRCCDYGDVPENPRVFVDLAGCEGEPDGSTVDADGAVWNAQWGASRVVRYLENGSEACTLHVAAAQPTRPTIGGPLLDTLFVTSARIGLPAAALAQAPHSGALFAAQVIVRGVPEPRFAGSPRSDPAVGPSSPRLQGTPTQ